MRTLLYFVAVLVVVSSCTEKESLIQDSKEGIVMRENVNSEFEPDVVYHYDGKAYPLYFKEGSENEYVEDENTRALDKLQEEHGGFVTFTFSHVPSNHYYWFNTEFDGYDYLEKNSGNPLAARNLKVSHRIEQLRFDLLDKYGEVIDYSNTQVYNDILSRIEAIYEELHMAGDLPRDLESFLGKPEQKTSIQRSPVMSVYEHTNLGGSELCLETAPNTIYWTHGAWNCYTLAANLDLSQELQPTGNNWDDCISSACIDWIDGADAVAWGFYKDINNPRYNCGALVFVEGNSLAFPARTCFNMPDQAWNPNFTCGHMNDQISSLKVKAVWQGCPQTYTDM